MALLKLTTKVLMEIKSKVWLKSIQVSSSKKQVFSLNHIRDQAEIYTDISSFRPDPSDYMKLGQKYDATIMYDVDSYNDHDIFVLRRIKIGEKIFVRIR
jgi:hypothetical protein